jgi:signal peptidase I
VNAGNAEPEVENGKGKGRSNGEVTNPTWSAEISSIESVVIDGRWRIVYTGPSMNPTLREPDLLWVEPYGDRRVRVGDVVCFKSSEQDINIVHRVVSVVRPGVDTGHSAVIRTRGDNNSADDLCLLHVGDIIGRVASAQRGLRLRPIPGGNTGRIVAWGVRLRKAIWRVIPGVGSGAYQRLVRSGPLGFLLPAGLRPRPVCFNGRGAPTLKLLMGSRTVGLYDFRFNEWHIRRLFRPFVDEQTLPEPKSEIQSSESKVLQ